MRHNQCIVSVVVACVVWLALVNLYLSYVSRAQDAYNRLADDLLELEQTLDSHRATGQNALDYLRELVAAQRLSGQRVPYASSPPAAAAAATTAAASASASSPPAADDQLPPIERDAGDDAVAVLLFACNRVTVRRALEPLVRYRPAGRRFAIVVSQDCVHEPTTRAIRAFGDRGVHLLRQPDQSEVRVPPKEKKFRGYFRIARHYRWALEAVFARYNFSQAVVVEDDLEVAPDFYEYFAAALPVLRADPTLWCVSAWNDNGKPELVDKSAADLLYRTDFFPGLGWMLTRALWLELRDKWPRSYWDDWMREPAQRRGRSCVRPEVSRTRTFGKVGVSNGLFYDKHLKYIYLNERYVEFTKRNLSYLRKEAYDEAFWRRVRASPVVGYQELKRGDVYGDGAVRVLYDGRASLKRVAKAFGLMDDLKSGVPRTAYQGVVSFAYRGRRVFLAPAGDSFAGYEPN